MELLRLLLKKILFLITSLLMLATFSFLLLRLLPGGPFDEETSLNPLVRQSLLERWGLNQPLHFQLAQYLKNLLQGDLGLSMVHADQSVAQIIGQSLGHTFSLGVVTFVFSILCAVTITLLSVRFRDRKMDQLIQQSMVAMLALPSLFWGPLLIYAFGFYFNILPVAFLQGPLSYILPVLTLSLRPIAILVRLLTVAVNKNIHEDYVRTAYAKGLGQWHVLLRHVLRNSLVPFLSYLGPLLATLISGSFLVEVLFAIPGLGSQFVASLSDRDYTVMVGLTLFYGSLLIVINSGLDFIIKYVDPRLREVSR